jgi:hypothetical protein
MKLATVTYAPTPIPDLIGRYLAIAQPEQPVSSLPSPEVVDYLCAVGLGPIAYFVYGTRYREESPDSYAKLRSADLTTRVIYSQQAAATEELLLAFGDAGVRAILLKGISVAERYYRLPHHRVMGDIDILFDRADIERAVNLVHKLGYERIPRLQADPFSERHHHLPPVRHRQSGVVVELHTGLFSLSSPATSQSIFAIESVRQHVVLSSFRETTAGRLSTDYELLYILAHWAADTKWGVNVLGALDVLCISRSSSPQPDWHEVRLLIGNQAWLSNCVAVFFLYLGNTKLFDVPAELKEFLHSRERTFGVRNLKLLCSVVHAFPFGSGKRTWLPLNREWSAMTFWRRMLAAEGRYRRIPVATLETIFSERNRYSPVRILKRAWELVFPGTTR